MTLPAEQPDSFDPNTRVLWGAKSIGRRIGRSPDFVRCVLARLPGSPIKTMNRSLFVLECDLLSFMRSYNGQ